MVLAAIASALHMIGLGAGVSAGVVRGLRLRGSLDKAGLEAMLRADNVYGLASIIWIGSGLWRAFSSLEKGTDYYLHNAAFHAKMTCLILLAIVEMYPMITFIKWRIALSKGQMPDTSKAKRFARLTFLELGLVIPMIVAAALMTRGFGMIGSSTP